MLSEFTYGDENGRGKKLQSLSQDDILFFHTTKRGKKVITAYYIVEYALPTEQAKKDNRISSKYNNPHLKKNVLANNDAIVFGNPITSLILRRPLEITREVIEGLPKKKLNLSEKQTELGAVSSTLRNWIKLDEKDINYLLNLIYKNEKEGILKDTLLSSDEITQIDEVDIEDYICSNPLTLGVGLELCSRQYILPSNKRIDILMKDVTNNSLVVVEVKKGPLGRDALKQIKAYISEVKKEFNTNSVKGILVGSRVLPAFEEVYAKEKEVKTFLYSWKFHVHEFIDNNRV